MRRWILSLTLVTAFSLFTLGCNDDPPTGSVSDASSDDATAADADTATTDSGSEEVGVDTGPQDTGGDPGDTSETVDSGSDTGSDCTSPAPSGCESDDDCQDGEVCKDDPDSCDPSSCSCSDGTWVCTDDCGGTVCMAESDSCSGPDPSGCETDADCADGEVCKDDPDSCDPSTCECTDGNWGCSTDCGGTVCMPKSNSCSKPDPSGCETDSDCGSGEVCRDDPDSCDPSTCECSNGQWLCTQDCGGSVCMPEPSSCSKPDPSGCETDSDCQSGEVCKDDPNSCDPSSCKCSNGKWVCTKDCAGTVCMPKTNSCSKPDPSGCETDSDCQSGEVCKDDPNSCDPSSCTCSNGKWICTRDCGGTVCMSKSNSCSGPDPSGCKTTSDCPRGEVCKNDPNSCTPSSCGCSNGNWTCTSDCNGTVCMSP